MAFPESTDGIVIAPLAEGGGAELVSVILDLEKFPALPDAFRRLLSTDEKLLLDAGEVTAHIYISSANAAALSNHTD